MLFDTSNFWSGARKLKSYLIRVRVRAHVRVRIRVRREHLINYGGAI